MKELVLAAVFALARGNIAADRTHLEQIAADVTAVVEAPGAPVLFEGPAAKEATALMLVAIAAHESGFEHAIDRCQKRGDGGRSRTMWQMIGLIHLQGHAPEKVCEDRRLAARLALDALALTMKRYPRSTPARMVNAYAAGEVDTRSPQSRQICSIWQTRAERQGLVGATCHKRQSVSFGAAIEPGGLHPAPAQGVSLRSIAPDKPAPALAAEARLALVPIWPRALVLSLLPPVAAMPACQTTAPGSDSMQPAPVASLVAPEATATARRPARRYYLGRTTERCEVYSVAGDVISKPEPTPCPADLLVGERIRLAGMTCIREATREEPRQRPVVCPDPLTNAEKHDRAERK